MIVLLQRVTSAPVSVNGERNAEIGHRRRGRVESRHHAPVRRRGSGLTFDTHLDLPSRVRGSNRADRF
jgi:hypothetical protein